MIYASTPPVNDDPKPWRTDPDGKEARSAERWRLRPYYGEYAPRPEHDRPRAHEANPILVEFRADFDGDMRGWHMWLILAREEMLSDGRCTLEHYDHARRVLERLARL